MAIDLGDMPKGTPPTPQQQAQIRSSIGLGSSGSAGFSSLVLTGQSITGTAANSLLDMTTTWNTSGIPSAIKLNVNDVASNAASNLLDLQVGGSSKFKVDKVGLLKVGGIGFSNSYGIITEGGISVGSGATFIAGSQLNVYNGGLNICSLNTGGIQTTNVGAITWGSGTSISTPDLYLSRRAAANLRVGAADAAAPVAQTLSVQSVIAGTTNTAGTNLTITGSQGTGTGAGGSVIFQVAPAGSSGSAQNALIPRVIFPATAAGGVAIAFNALDSSNVGLRSSGTTLDIIRADAGAYANLTANSITAQGTISTSYAAITSNINVAGTTGEQIALITSASSNGTPANGFGTRIALRTQSSTTIARDSGAIATLWTDATDATRTSDLLFYNALNGTLTERLRILGNGSLLLGTSLLIPGLGGGGRWSFGSTGTSGRGLFINPDNKILNVSFEFSFGWSSGSAGDNAADVVLFRDAAGTLAQRNSTNAQTFRVYNSTDATPATNFDRATFGWTSNVLKIGTEMGGSYTTARYLELLVGGVTKVTISPAWVTFGDAVFADKTITIKGSGTSTAKSITVTNSGSAERFSIQDNGTMTNTFGATTILQHITRNTGIIGVLGNGANYALNYDTINGRVGIGDVIAPTEKLEVNGNVKVSGHFSAATKSFLIDHPTKAGKKLQYGVVESNQHSVLVRGKTAESIIELPEEWAGLVHEDSVTVQLTPIDSYQSLFVISQDNQKVVVGGSNGQYNYTIYGERKDVDKLVTEI